MSNDSPKCTFCKIRDIDMALKNDLCFAIYDSFPVSSGHMLIIPFRHFENFFECTDEEMEAIWDLLQKCKKMLSDDLKPDGFNVGVNIGKISGQTIFHTHVHVIPRYIDDVDDPRGGIRGVIPEKRIY